MKNSVYNDQKIGRVVRSVSLTHEDDALIQELGLSISGLLRQRIEQVRHDSSEYAKRSENKSNIIALLEERIRTLEVLKNGSV